MMTEVLACLKKALSRQIPQQRKTLKGHLPCKPIKALDHENLLTLNFDSADNITGLKSWQDTYIT